MVGFVVRIVSDGMAAGLTGSSCDQSTKSEGPPRFRGGPTQIKLVTKAFFSETGA